jgi:phosphoglycolate phosphatase
MKNYSLLIFDWDGTLVNSIGFIADCIEHTARKLNLDIPPRDAILTSIGLPFENMIASLFTSVDFSSFKQTFFNYYTGDKKESNFFIGAIETLKYLKTRGFSLGIATNKSRSQLNNTLTQYKINHLFSETRCPEDGFAKPNPWMLQDIMDKLLIDPKDVLMIGDTIYDMQFAQNAGVDSLAVTYGSHTREKLLPYNPVAYIDDITKLKNLFASPQNANIT